MRAKKHKSCCITIYVHVHVRTYIRIRVNCAFTYDDLFQQYGYVNSIELSTKQLEIARHL